LQSKAPRSERGASAVELALALPLLAIVLIGTIDFGRLFYRAMTVTHGARAGAQYGAQSVGKATDHNGMRDAAIAAASDAAGAFTAAATHFCTCFTVALGESGQIPCTQVCTGQLRVYTQVTGTAGFTTIVNYPGIPHTVSITRTVQMRAQ
jgi:Flp pilus assembly protein TadG